MKKPNRIGMNLFDDEIKTLINASAKIFPLTQEMIDNNLNPSNYEYGKLDRGIYKWFDSRWEYIIADDIDIKFSDIKELPVSYPPSEHSHNELHSHENKSILDTITQVLIDGWNSAKDHISDVVRHITGEERTLWNTVSNKSDYNHNHDINYSPISHEHDYSPSSHNHDTDYSPIIHNHDGAYHSKTYVDGELAKKENKFTNRTVLDKITETLASDNYDLSMIDDIDERLAMIEGGYSEGHAHNNLDTLGKIEYSGANSVVDLAEFEGKAEEIHTHPMTDITGLSLDYSAIENKPLVFPPDVHNHNTTDIIDMPTIPNSTSQLTNDSGFLTALPTHNHNDTYYTESEVNTLLTGKADSTTLSGHTDNATVHVTQIDKDNWNAKPDTDTVYTHPASHPASMITGLPTSLPANGGNADTVGGFTVAKSVPSNALFTDTNTTYTAGNGLTLTGTSFAVGTPGSLTNATTNAVTATSHTHNVSGFLPLTGGTMTGILYPQRNTSYTTGQARRIVLSTADPSGGGNGDVWIKYTP